VPSIRQIAHRAREVSVKVHHPGIFFCCFLLFFIFSCTSEIPIQEVRVKRGIVYQKGDEEPFTGYIVGKSNEDYRDQKCRFKKQYKDGVLDGRSEFFYPNGKLESIEPYKNGELHGIVTRYHDNGKIRARIHFVEGLRGGNKGEMFWDKNGKKIRG
jgi:antitoxin component YwqK of YwqJK toxin-antitoxin module